MAARTKRTICLFTGTRAEYGLLQPLIEAISSDPDLQLQLMVSGAHLSPEFGLTYQVIESDGFKIDAAVEMLLSSDTAVGITKSLGLGVIGFADALQRLQPDILVLLGDRYEVLAAAQAALIARIPIAHIHGGETTKGAFDESIRHAVTKMAQWHFVAAEPYRRRVIQMGESPDRVFNVGAPGLDHLRRMRWLDRDELAESLDIALESPLLLVTYHPETLGVRRPLDILEELLSALDGIADATLIFTYSNSDTGGRALNERLHEWAGLERNRSRVRVVASLGTQRYLSLMRIADVVVGNSSSAIVEAPALQRAVVNIGARQKGRLKASSIIDAQENAADISRALKQALGAEFQATLRETSSLYGVGEAGISIKQILKSLSLGTEKSFFDIQHEH